MSIEGLKGIDLKKSFKGIKKNITCKVAVADNCVSSARAATILKNCYKLFMFFFQNCV